MRSLLIGVAALLAMAGAAVAHPATEQFIPIGQSPGPGVVSGTAGAVAEPAGQGSPTIVSVDREGAQVGAYIVTPATRVYIDRSAQGLPNLVGALEDVQPGRVIEVRIANDGSRAAEWIKVRP